MVYFSFLYNSQQHFSYIISLILVSYQQVNQAEYAMPLQLPYDKCKKIPISQNEDQHFITSPWHEYHDNKKGLTGRLMWNGSKLTKKSNCNNNALWEKHILIDINLKTQNDIIVNKNIVNIKLYLNLVLKRVWLNILFSLRG